MPMRLALLCVLVSCGASGATTDAPAPDAAGVDAARTADAQPLGPVHVVITADNAYSFGYGDVTGITHFIQGTRAEFSEQIFNCPIGLGPEVYTIPEADAPEGSYLYIVTWDDLFATQGVLGEFRRDTGAVATGDPRFDVCATGLDYSSGPDAVVGPSQATVNDQITACNGGTGNPGTTSKGWVNSAGAVTTAALGRLAIGELNDNGPGTTFPIACQPTATSDGIGSTARWMWYDPDDGGGDAFHSTGTNRFKAFLIFRLGIGTIIE